MIRKFLENNCGDFIDTEATATIFFSDSKRVGKKPVGWKEWVDRLNWQEQFDVDCYTESRFSVADSFVAGAYATSYFRGAKDPFKPRSFPGLSKSHHFSAEFPWSGCLFSFDSIDFLRAFCVQTSSKAWTNHKTKSSFEGQSSVEMSASRSAPSNWTQAGGLQWPLIEK